MTRKSAHLMIAIIVLYYLGTNSCMENNNLFSAIRIIINDVMIADSTQFFIYATYNKSSQAQFFYFNDIINEVVGEIKNATLKVSVHRPKTFYNLKHQELILLDNMESFYLFYSKLYKVGSMNLSHTLMFISSLTTLDASTLSTIFRHLYHMSILNIALIVQVVNEDIVVVTYFPFTPTSCHSFSPVVINSYSATVHQWNHLNYFPKKLHNFHSCPVICATWEIMPYLQLNINTTDNFVIEYKGFEGKILEFIAKELNFTTKIYIMNEDVINDAYNGSTWVFGEIFSKYADFSMGGYQYNEDFATLPYSQTIFYHLSDIYAVANVFSDYSAYEKMIYPFTTSLWWTIGGVFALSSILICMFNNRCRYQRNLLIGSANQTPYYHLFSTAMGANMTTVQLPRNNFARFLLTCWMLTTLILRSGYQSGMYQMMRDNKQHNPPQTIADLASQNYAILLMSSHKRLFDILSLKDVRYINEAALEQFPKMIETNERIAMVTPYEYFGYWGKVNVSTLDHLHLVKERIYTQQLVFNVRRNSYLVNELNYYIGMAQYYGLMNRWANDNFKLPVFYENRCSERESPANVLSMQELGAVFIFLLWLHLIAAVVFAVEIMWCRCTTLALARIVRRH